MTASMTQPNQSENYKKTRRKSGSICQDINTTYLSFSLERKKSSTTKKEKQQKNLEQKSEEVNFFMTHSLRDIRYLLSLLFL
jgi:hypothetical protein